MNTTQSQPPAAGEAAHTPTPWFATPPAPREFSFTGRDETIWGIGSKEGNADVAVASEANAAFIVRACNAYEANQAELSRLRAVNAELLGALKGIIDSADFEPDGTEGAADLGDRLVDIEQQACAAIARGEGGGV